MLVCEVLGEGAGTVSVAEVQFLLLQVNEM